MNNIETRVKQVVADILSVPFESIENNHSFQGELGADSLDSVELVMEFEDAFSVEISEAAARKMLTVQSVIDFLSELPEEELDNKEISI